MALKRRTLKKILVNAAIRIVEVLTQRTQFQKTPHYHQEGFKRDLNTIGPTSDRTQETNISREIRSRNLSNLKSSNK